jgi:thymidylate kinase
MIEELNSFATGGLVPDLTIVFDLDPAMARARLGSRSVADCLARLTISMRTFTSD